MGDGEATRSTSVDSASGRAGDGGDADVEAKLADILELLDDEKAIDVMSIDLRGKSAFADFMVIASGRSTRHVGAICDKLIEALKERGGPRPRAEGVENGDWALIDASDVVIHVFRPEVREFYALEKMWAPAPITGGESAD
ncbi:MAG: ribosome silencing factor [Pseudomonadota bacterium]